MRVCNVYTSQNELGADPGLNVDNARVFTDTSFGLQIRLLFCPSSIYGRKHPLVNADLSRVYVPARQDLYCQVTAQKGLFPNHFVQKIEFY
jgi:hypothetical protein